MDAASAGDSIPVPPAAVSFVTTEHFTLQGARAATIAESTGRATMFLGTVSAGLIALGLFATATRLGTAFNAFGLVVLATLSLLGLATFERVVQSGLEDFGYAQRIARLRSYYFDAAPELERYLLSVQPAERLHVLGLWGGRLQGFRNVAGAVAAVTSVLAGSISGLLAAAMSNGSLPVWLGIGAAVTLAVETALMRYQRNAWDRALRSAASDEGVRVGIENSDTQK